LFACGGPNAKDDSGSKSSRHCVDDGCATVEEGHYKSDLQNVSTARPDFGVSLLANWIQLVSTLAKEEFQSSTLSNAEPPPELSSSWRFVSRVALPARAPSLLS
jgi:hypothetical protein